MLTSSNELKLLEINSNPALSLDNSTLEALLPKVIDDTIDIVLTSQGFKKDTKKPLKMEEFEKFNLESIPTGEYELIFDESSNFVYS